MPLNQRSEASNSKQRETELAAKLAAALERIEELEEQLVRVESEAGRPERIHQRQALDTPIECIGDFDLIQARGIDLSSSGICFEVLRPIRFDMRFEFAGQKHRYSGHLVWVKPVDGIYRLGFEFAPPESAAEF